MAAATTLTNTPTVRTMVATRIGKALSKKGFRRPSIIFSRDVNPQTEKRRMYRAPVGGVRPSLEDVKSVMRAIGNETVREYPTRENRSFSCQFRLDRRRVFSFLVTKARFIATRAAYSNEHGIDHPPVVHDAI